MYNSAKPTVLGLGTVAVLPDTGVFRPLFMVGVALLAIGAISFVAAGVASVRQRTSKEG